MKQIKILVIGGTSDNVDNAYLALTGRYDVSTVVNPRPAHKFSMVNLSNPNPDILVVYGNYEKEWYYLELNHHNVPTVYVNPDSAPHIFELPGLNCPHEVIRGWQYESRILLYCVQKLLEG